MMRILFDARRAVRRATGVGQLIEGLLGALAQTDGRNEYLVLYGEKNPLAGCQAPNFETRHYPTHFNSLAVTWELPRLARQWRAAVAYFPFWLMPLTMPCPSVVTIHDLLYSHFPRSVSPQRKLAQDVYTALAARRARRIHAPSASTRRDLERYFAIPTAKIDVIPSAVPAHLQVAAAAPAAAAVVARRFSLERPFALYVGNHKPHKNLARLLSAYAAVHTQVAVDLVIAGAKSSYADPDTLPDLARAQPLVAAGRVHFLGQVEDASLAALYASAQFFIFPSLHEGFGFPPLEAMQHGTPVACSNTSSLPEVVGDAALTFDPLDEAQIAAAMVRLDQEPELRARLARAGPEQVRRFSWHASAQKWLASLGQAAGGA